MHRHQRFQPDWTSAPANTIVDILRERNISYSRFSSLMRLSIEDTNDILQGRSTISLSIARKLTRTLGASIEFWMTRDFQYRHDSKQLRAEEVEWLRKLPLSDMINFGWLRTPPPSKELKESLRFFEVANVPAWKRKYAAPLQMAAFRSSPTFEAHLESTAAWLRQGEIEAANIHCAPWNPELFQQQLCRIRPLTRQKNPNHFIPLLQRSCSPSGVAVVIVRAPRGCRASGAVRFITDKKAILQLSFRYLTDDQFWFTFFHESGHLVKHGEQLLRPSVLNDHRPWILEGSDVPVSDEEQDANDFAAQTLLPTAFQDDLFEVPLHRRAIIKLAQRANVSPGIIVGQLQHHGRIGYDKFNGLKRRFTWVT